MEAGRADGTEQERPQEGQAQQDSQQLRVGYALREKRIGSFITPELVEHGRKEGVSFVRVDPARPLEEQGPFNLLLHKLEGDDWAKSLKEYGLAHPEVVVVDEYDAVHKLDDRRQMLEVVSLLDSEKLGAKVEVPAQLILEKGTDPAAIPDILDKAGFRLPAVAKPLEANGTTSSHTLGLVLHKQAFVHLQPPVVLQEFVNHGGILFKLYLLGDNVMVFRRQSLPDIPPLHDLLPPAEGDDDAAAAQEGQAGEDAAGDGDALSVAALLKKSGGIVEFNRISNVHLSEEELRDSRVTDPPPEFMQALGISMRNHLQLHAFNVDILREGGHGNRYYIVDINYMPGYERIPGFPSLFVDFVKTTVRTRELALKELGVSVPEAGKLAAAAAVDRGGLLSRELTASLGVSPTAPYPVLMGKKKWVYVKAAMKLCGLEHRTRSALTTAAAAAAAAKEAAAKGGGNKLEPTGEEGST